MASFFAVRHFSPACAYYVQEFLTRTAPDVVLIEGPADLSGMIPQLCEPSVQLPAALLAYTEEAPVRTVLWPLAEFSPEYQAMRWAAANGIPAVFCDLPSDCVLALQEKENAEQSEETDETENIPKPESVYQRLEASTGLDNDTFWEYLFEGCRDYDDFLAAVTEYGASLRAESEQDDRNALREAYMRRCIAEQEQKYGKAAVITGAFHTAGISGQPYSDADKIMTGKLPTVRSRSTLMPYSYYRLSSRSGYGAGSKAPGFYEILWHNRCSGTPERTAAEYLSRLAACQRKNGNLASSAQIIDALRLADTLTAMRGGTLPALSDLRDAAVTCLGNGSFGEISVACAEIEISTKIGVLPEGAVCTSVQDDFMRQLKELKLERFRTAAAQELELDLRENLRVKSEKSAFLDLNRSFLLHRLCAAGIHFGKPLLRTQDNATWAEKWSLQWIPETEIELVEASLTGDTVEEAAAQAINLRLHRAQSMKETASALSEAFACGLPDCVKSAVSAVQAMAADCVSPADEGETIGTLSGIVRFGNIRRINPEPLQPLLKQLYLKFCLQTEQAAICDRAAADLLIPAAAAVSDACTTHDFLDEALFVKLLHALSDNNFVNPVISGFACAMLIERGKIENDALSALISRRLSAGTPPAEAAAWFEGLTMRSRRSLIVRLSLWEKLCAFVSSLDDAEFKPVLVALRRTFSVFTPAEKSDIAENIGEILGISALDAAEMMTAPVTAEDQQMLDSLDDFDFDDI